MSEDTSPAGGTGPSHRIVEIAVAIAIALFGALTVAGSLKVGIGWTSDGPQSGFFPFYVGVTILVCGGIAAIGAFRSAAGGPFASWEQLRQVASLLVPTAIYVLAIPFTGIYLASALLIALFMKWLGRYPWLLTIGVAVGVPVVVYFVFERWFLVPLPKGPIEEWLGL